MGCNQSDEASNPVANPTMQRSGVAATSYSPAKGAEGTAITMIGNTAVHGLVLVFSGSSFHPVPCRVPIPRYCHALVHDKTTGYITGGIEDLQSNVSSKATLESQILEGTISKKFLKVNLQKLLEDPANSFENFPDMINARYAHCAIKMENGIFVIGGRQYGNDENGLLSACEKYDFGSRKWKAIASLQYPRAAASVVSYGEHLYLFGGYSGNNTRTRVIETYSDGDSSWKKLPYLLHEGFEGALVLKKPGSETSVLVFGGKTNIERSNRVVEINIDRTTVTRYCAMKEGRSFHKGRVIGNEVVLIGGGCESVEQYFPQEQRSQINKELSYLQFCTMKELNSFSQFQQSIHLSFQKRPGEVPRDGGRISVFGNSAEPFAYHLSCANLIVSMEGQSLAHNFYQFTNVIRVNKEYCFVLGGISSDLADVTASVYSYNLLNNEIKYLDLMAQPRYAFGTTVLGSHLYAIGGRKLGDDDVAILGVCERFSFQTYQWEGIAPLKHRRQSPTVVPVGEYVLVIGGYKGNGQRANEMELYIPRENRWVELEAKFELSVEAMTPVQFMGVTYLFGGRADSDIQKVFKLVIDIDEGVKFEKCLRPELQPVGFLSNPGTNLKVFVVDGVAYVFGNIPHGVDIYDLKQHKVIGGQQIKVFSELSDPYFQAYTLIN